MSHPTTPDKKKTKDHPKRYGSKGKPRKASMHKSEIDSWLTSAIKTLEIPRGKGGRPVKAPKMTQIAVLAVLLHFRGWDSKERRPSRECRTTISKIAMLLESTRETVGHALKALETQEIIHPIPGGWRVSDHRGVSDDPTLSRVEGVSDDPTLLGVVLSDDPTPGAANPSYPSSLRSSVEGRRGPSGPSSADASSLRSSSSATSRPSVPSSAAAAKPGEGGRGAPPAAAAVTTRGKGEKNEKNEKNERRELLDDLIGKSNHSWHEGDGWSGSIFGILLEGKKRNTIRILYWWNQGGACSVGVDRYGVWLPLGVIKEETRNIRKYLGDSWGMEDTLVAWEKELFKKFGKRGKEGKMKEEEREKIMSNPPGWFRKVVARDYKEETREWTWDVLGFVPPGDAWVGRYLKDVEGDGSPDEGDRGGVSPVEEEEEDHLSPDGEDEESGDISPAWEDMEGDWDLLGEEDMEGESSAWDLEETDSHPSPVEDASKGRRESPSLSLPWGSPGDIPPDLH